MHLRSTDTRLFFEPACLGSDKGIDQTDPLLPSKRLETFDKGGKNLGRFSNRRDRPRALLFKALFDCRDELAGQPLSPFIVFHLRDVSAEFEKARQGNKKARMSRAGFLESPADFRAGNLIAETIDAEKFVEMSGVEHIDDGAHGSDSTHLVIPSMRFSS